LDPALRRPGRLDKEIIVMPPNTPQRKLILAHHCAKLPLHNDVDLLRIAESSSGYTGADLAAVCQEAARLAMSQSVKEWRSGHAEQSAAGRLEPIESKERDTPRKADSIGAHCKAGEAAVCASQEASKCSAVTQRSERTGFECEVGVGRSRSGCSEGADQALRTEGRVDGSLEVAVRAEHFVDALQIARPSLLRGLAVDVQPLSWDDIGGLEVCSVLRAHFLHVFGC
jgi:SpoVK/Ycf46/Vps4 family AAA+-type ATPase